MLSPWGRVPTFAAQHQTQIVLGIGQGVPQDGKTLVKWYSLAAEQGNAAAQYNVGLIYYNGQGVIQDNVYAHMWWNIAASTGLEGADIHALGKIRNRFLKSAARLGFPGEAETG